jgi:hypothetical protein
MTKTTRDSFVAVALVAAAAAPSFAEPPAASPPQSSAKAVTVSGDPNQVICEKQEVTGSRLAVKRVCLTRSQWAERRLQDRQELERVQVERGLIGE